VIFLDDTCLEIPTKKFTYFFPLDRFYYSNDPGHIWFKKINTLIEIGFDDFGQKQAGHLHHIRTRRIDNEYQQGRAFGTVESDKWMGQLRLPLSGILKEVNEKVIKNPSLVNKDCYSNWIVRIEPTDFDKEIKSPDIIKQGECDKLRDYITSDLQKYDEPPI